MPSPAVRYTLGVVLLAPWVATAAGLAAEPGTEVSEYAEPADPGTLFQWSYGTSFSGGPQLDEPLETDRPDFTEASVTVGRGVAQLEFGYTYVYDNDGGRSTRLQSFGEPLLRYGVLADWLELRLALFPLEERVRDAVSSNTTAGTDDLYLGAKLALTPQEGLLPEMALTPQARIPTGSSAFSADEVLPGLNWLYGWDVLDYLSVGGSTQVNRAVEDLDDGTRDSYSEFAQSLTTGVDLTDEFGAYVEWFGIIPHSAEAARTEHYADGGFKYLLSDDVQWDVRAGWGLNDAADDFFWGTGLSVRFK